MQFTRESAERIANVVRSTEVTPRAASPLTFERLESSPQVAFRFAYYTATANWSGALYHGPTNSTNTKQIMFVSGGLATNSDQATALSFATGQTAMCLNNFQYLPLVSTNATAAKMLVLVAKSHGIWRLVGAQQ